MGDDCTLASDMDSVCHYLLRALVVTADGGDAERGTGKDANSDPRTLGNMKGKGHGDEHCKSAIASVWASLAQESVILEEKLYAQLREVREEVERLSRPDGRLLELRREVALRRSVPLAAEDFDADTANAKALREEARRRVREGLAHEILPENLGYRLLRKMGFIPGSGLGYNGKGRLFPVALPSRIKTHRGGIGYYRRNSPWMGYGFESKDSVKTGGQGSDKKQEPKKRARDENVDQKEADRDFLVNESFLALAARRPRFTVDLVDGAIVVVGESSNCHNTNTRSKVGKANGTTQRHTEGLTEYLMEAEKLPGVENQYKSSAELCHVPDMSSPIPDLLLPTGHFSFPSVLATEPVEPSRQGSSLLSSASSAGHLRSNLSEPSRLLNQGGFRNVFVGSGGDDGTYVRDRSGSDEEEDEDWLVYNDDSQEDNDQKSDEQDGDLRDWNKPYTSVELKRMTSDYLAWRSVEIVNEDYDDVDQGASLLNYNGQHLDSCCDASDLEFFASFWDVFIDMLSEKY